MTIRQGKCVLLSAVVTIAASVAWADSYFINRVDEDPIDMADLSIYDAGHTSLPGPEDSIGFAGDGKTLRTYKLDPADADSWAVFTNCHHIILHDQTSLEITVPEGQTAEFERAYVNSYCHYEPVFGGSTRIVKKGAGKLLIACSRLVNFNFVSNKRAVIQPNIEVLEGELEFGQVAASDKSNTFDSLQFGELHVASGAKFSLPWRDNSTCFRSYFTRFVIDAGGTLNSYSPRASGNTFGGLNMSTEKNPHPAAVCIIKGAVTGYIYPYTYLDIDYDTTGYAGTAAQALGGVTLRATRLASSCVGAGTMLLGGGSSGIGGKFVYLGTGEEVKRGISFLCQKPRSGESGNPVTFDAGTTGGITFLYDQGCPFGPAQSWVSDSVYSVSRMVLTGDNALPVVFKAYFSAVTNTAGGTTTIYPAYVNKKGTGTWSFEGGDWTEMNHYGVTQISDGTLRFVSIADTGLSSSLGFSNNLRPDDTRAVANGQTVDYAFALGANPGETGTPTFEYTGAAKARTDRKIALVGQGGTLKATSATLDWNGVSARDANATPTLTLDGPTEGNLLRNVTDGAAGARVSIVKNGTGSWTLKGEQDISGDVNVNAGRLALKLPHKRSHITGTYRYFRFNFCEVW